MQLGFPAFVNNERSRLIRDPSYGTLPAFPDPVGQAPGVWAGVFRDEFTASTIKVLDPANGLVQLSPGGPTWGTWWPSTLLVDTPTPPAGVHAGIGKEYWDYTKAATDGGSNAVLTATQDFVHSGVGFNYTSALLHSSFAFNQLYGYFETRMYAPGVSGSWPSFWMLPSNYGPHSPPEIDIFENFGDAGFYKASNFGSGSTVFADVINTPINAWHVYGLKWTATQIIWYLDGVAVASESTVSAIPTAPMFVLCQLSVISETTPTFQLLVDYVRCWQ
jgi:hypothetical protein